MVQIFSVWASRTWLKVSSSVKLNNPLVMFSSCRTVMLADAVAFVDGTRKMTPARQGGFQ
ncbi:MAG TPA: hypothetical protein VJ757_06450 [Pseudonocardiaceae bacterium]|nr:hypothetical protein [Pseudonocardiaceae bacterium]